MRVGIFYVTRFGDREVVTAKLNVISDNIPRSAFVARILTGSEGNSRVVIPNVTTFHTTVALAGLMRNRVAVIPTSVGT